MKRAVKSLEKMCRKKPGMVSFVLVSAVVLLAMAVLPPQRYGDGNEHFLTLESLSNHLSPDLRSGDVEDFYEGGLNAFGEMIPPYSGYFRSFHGSYYAYHFFAYPLASVPAKVLLEALALDARKAFQVTNAVLFVMLLSIIAFRSGLKERQKLALISMIVFSPVLWFLHWTHPEIFSFVFVMASLMLMDRGRYRLAVASAAIASLQAMWLGIFVLFILAKGIAASGKRFRDIAALLAVSMIALVPVMFYLVNFGQLSLLQGTVSVGYASPFRILEMFFDLNVGLLPYMPMVLPLFICMVAWRTWKEKALTLELSLLIVMISMMAICSMTNNWNHGTAGPLRYSIVMLPLAFFVIVKNLRVILGSRLLKGAFIAGIVLQLLIVASAGGFVTPQDNYIRFTMPAKFVLDVMPAAYSPSYEIFCERALHMEFNCIRNSTYVTVYKNDVGECRKALLTCDGIGTLRAVCGSVGESAEQACASGKNGWFYVSY